MKRLIKSFRLEIFILVLLSMFAFAPSKANSEVTDRELMNFLANHAELIKKPMEDTEARVLGYLVERAVLRNTNPPTTSKVTVSKTPNPDGTYPLLFEDYTWGRNCVGFIERDNLAFTVTDCKTAGTGPVKKMDFKGPSEYENQVMSLAIHLMMRDGPNIHVRDTGKRYNGKAYFVSEQSERKLNDKRSGAADTVKQCLYEATQDGNDPKLLGCISLIRV